MKGQKGWTIWSLLIVMGLVVFFAMLFIKLVPPYLDNIKIRDALVDVSKDPKIARMTKRDIIKSMQKTLYIDFAVDVVDLYEDLTIEKTERNKVLKVEYEVIVPLAYNISALLDFRESATAEF